MSFPPSLACVTLICSLSLSSEFSSLEKLPVPHYFPNLEKVPTLFIFLLILIITHNPSVFFELISHSLLEVKSQEGEDFFFLKIIVVFLVPNIGPDILNK